MIRPAIRPTTMLAALLVACVTASARATAVAGPSVWPDLEQFVRVVSLRDYNTRVVVIGTMLLGLASGVVGTYMLLRRRALIGDALSHATLPGIGIAFIVMVHLGGTGKFMPGLLLGAWLSGLAGVGAIMLIKSQSRIREDAALGIVLSVAFGLGVALLGIIQRMPEGNQAGLESFIYGKTASMLRADAVVIGVAALVVLATCTLLYKEFALLSFDSDFASTQGWPTTTLDLTMMLLVTGVTVIGLQAVGLILVIAMLIIPAAASRFWTNHLRTMLVVSGTIGAVSGFVGAGLSALVPNLPAGAVIVVVAAVFFVVSLVVGAQRGLLVRGLVHIRLRHSVARQHLLRAVYEWLETREALDDPGAVPIPRAALASARSWSPRRLARTVAAAVRRGWLEPAAGDALHVTRAGLDEAARVVRNHRLWEIYLITHADIAPSHVDRDADQIEHVLGPGMVVELARVLADNDAARALARIDAARVPASPHALGEPDS